MTPKEIMKMDPETRLALEARARVGDVEAVSNWVLSSAWRSILGSKAMSAKEKVRAFMELCNGVKITVEAQNG